MERKKKKGGEGEEETLKQQQNTFWHLLQLQIKEYNLNDLYALNSLTKGV